MLEHKMHPRQLDEFLVRRATNRLGFKAWQAVDVAVGGYDKYWGTYTEDMRNKLRMLGGPHGKTIWKMMQLRGD